MTDSKPTKCNQITPLPNIKSSHINSKTICAWYCYCIFEYLFWAWHLQLWVWIFGVVPCNTYFEFLKIQCALKPPNVGICSILSAFKLANQMLEIQYFQCLALIGGNLQCYQYLEESNAGRCFQCIQALNCWDLQYFECIEGSKYAIRDKSRPLSTHSKLHDEFQTACLITCKLGITAKIKFWDFFFRSCNALHDYK